MTLINQQMFYVDNCNILLIIIQYMLQRGTGIAKQKVGVVSGPRTKTSTNLPHRFESYRRLKNFIFVKTCIFSVRPTQSHIRELPVVLSRE